MLKRIALILGVVAMVGCSNHEQVAQTMSTQEMAQTKVMKTFEDAPTVAYSNIMADATAMTPMDKYDEPLYQMDAVVQYSIDQSATPALMKVQSMYHEVDDTNHIVLMKHYMSKQLRLATYTVFRHYELNAIVSKRAEFQTDIQNVLKLQIAAEPWAKQLNVEQVMITNMVFTPQQKVQFKQPALPASPMTAVLYLF